MSRRLGSTSQLFMNRRRRVAKVILYICLVALFGFIFSAACTSRNIECGSYKTWVYTQKEEAPIGAVTRAIRQMNIDAAQVTNIVTASQQAGLELHPGSPVYVCLESGEKRVAKINDVTITGGYFG